MTTKMVQITGECNFCFVTNIAGSRVSVVAASPVCLYGVYRDSFIVYMSFTGSIAVF